MIISKNIAFKKKLTNEEKIALFQQASDAKSLLDKKTEENKEQQEAFKALKEEQGKIISQSFAKFKSGFKVEIRECQVTYENGIATYTDVKTGEIVVEQPISEEEQLVLNNGRINAEDVIRNARREED